MLDINLIRKQPEFVKAAIAKRGIFVSFDDMLDKDKEVRSLKAKTDELKAERNKVSKSIPELKKANKPVEAVFESMRLLGEQIEAADLKIKQLEEDIF